MAQRRARGEGTGLTPTIPADEVRIVYRTASWDGTPLSGHAWYQGRYCYFSGYGDWQEENGRRRYVEEWALFELVEPYLTQELAARKLFEDMVGYHCTYLDDPKASVPARRMDRNPWWEDFYEAERWRHIVKREVDTSKLPLLGHFSRVSDWDEDED